MPPNTRVDSVAVLGVGDIITSVQFVIDSNSWTRFLLDTGIDIIVLT